MTRTVTGVAVLLMVMTGGVVVAVNGGGSASFASRAGAICTDAQRKFKAIPSSPTSIPDALAVERSALAVLNREVTQLHELQPPADMAGPFNAGLSDDQQLLALFRNMLSRPDFAQLAITVPGNPNLAPAWLHEWRARTQALQADAQDRFAQIGLTSCEKALS